MRCVVHARCQWVGAARGRWFSVVVSVMLLGQLRRSCFHVARATIFALLRLVWGTGSSARTTPGTNGTAEFYFVVRVAGERHAFGHGRCRRVLGVRCARSDERHVLRAESVGAHTIDDACGDG